MLATFRERLRVTEAYNELARLSREVAAASSTGGEGAAAPQPALPRYREVKAVVVSPERFFPMARILDYDERADRRSWASMLQLFEERLDPI